MGVAIKIRHIYNYQAQSSYYAPRPARLPSRSFWCIALPCSNWLIMSLSIFFPTVASIAEGGPFVGDGLAGESPALLAPSSLRNFYDTSQVSILKYYVEFAKTYIFSRSITVKGGLAPIVPMRTAASYLLRWLKSFRFLFLFGVLFMAMYQQSIWLANRLIY